MSSVAAVDLVRVPVSWRTTWSVVRVRLDNGRVGWGECSDAHIVELLTPHWAAISRRYVGLDLDEALAEVASDARRAALGMGASRALPAESTLLGGLDQALCDLAAQQLGIPLTAYFGGPTGASSIALYANINRGVRERTPQEFARVARAAVAAGFSAVKCAPFDFLVGDRRVDTGLRLAEAVREAVGADVGLMLDAHLHVGLDELGAVAGRIRELGLRWIEDVAFVDDADSVKRAREVLDVPQAAGEFATRPDQVVAAIQSGALDIFMPDVKHAGGDRSALELGRIAVAAGVEVSVHNPTGPIASAHSAAVSAALPTATILECAFGEVPWRERLLDDPGCEAAGRARTSGRPGLGVGVDTDELERRAAAVGPLGHLHPGRDHFAQGVLA